MADQEKLLGFLQWVLGPNQGYVCLGYRVPKTGAWHETFYRWPDEQERITEYIQRRALIGDLYFCPNVLRRASCTKDDVDTVRVAYADLDACHPDKLKVPPSCVIETSPERYQAYWLLKRGHDPLEIEALNKRIAYAHTKDGCDKTGWNLAKRLRIPNTTNHKYSPDILPVRAIVVKPSLAYEMSDFDVYPHLEGTDILLTPMPDDLYEYDATTILARIQSGMHPRAWQLMEFQPDEHEWSQALWTLELLLFGAGLSAAEVFAVVKASACNKYKRDGKPDHLLWGDVLRAKAHNERAASIVHDIQDETGDAFHVPDKPLLTDKERKWAQANPCIVDDYIEWGKTVGDAAPQYHEAGAFVTLACLLAGSIQLPTSFGTVIPNLWFMILADTTLTRKTTAMDMSMDILTEIDSDVVLATDGSIEGLMQSLSMRPGRASVFLRDEFSGFLELVTKREWAAGMLETLTKLYDGKYQKRVLRKETIEVRDPRLILFTGGIKENIYKLLTGEHINSGFVPRFCFITAESDITRRRAIGPPTERQKAGREDLIQRFRDVYKHYSAPVRPDDTDGDDDVIDFAQAVWTAELTAEAWKRYNQFEEAMLQMGLGSSSDHLLTPVLVRLSQSGLKAAVLLAAADDLATDTVIVREHHIVKALYYVENWKKHALNVVANAGRTTTEKELQKIYTYVCEQPGSSRGKIMQKFYLTARSADAIFATLLQRGLIRLEKNAKSETYYPIKATVGAKTNDG